MSSKNTKYRLRVQVGINEEGNPINKNFYGKTKKEAEEKKRKFLNEMDLGIRFESISINECIQIWLSEVLKPKSKLATYERYETIFRLYIKDTIIGKKKVKEVKGIDIQRFYNQEFTRIQNANKIKSINKLLKYFFNYAVKEDYIIKNPCVGAVIPREINKQVKEIKPFTNEETEKIQNGMVGHNYEMLFLLAMGTGARQGELLALTKEDINLEECTININKTIKFLRVDGHYKPIVSDTKTTNSSRIIPFPKNLKEKFLKHIEKEKNKYKKLGKEFKKEDFVFTTYMCKPIESNSLRKFLARLCLKIQIPYRNFHNFRHTFATRLFEMDVPLKTVSILLGHSDINITANTYTHVMPKQKLEAISKIEELFNF